jgi:hypothetical protein
MPRAWILLILLGALLLVMALADLAWGKGVSWLQLVLGLVLIGLAVAQRRGAERRGLNLPTVLLPRYLVPSSSDVPFHL